MDKRNSKKNKKIPLNQKEPNSDSLQPTLQLHLNCTQHWTNSKFGPKQTETLPSLEPKQTGRTARNLRAKAPQHGRGAFAGLDGLDRCGDLWVKILGKTIEKEFTLYFEPNSNGLQPKSGLQPLPGCRHRLPGTAHTGSRGGGYAPVCGCTAPTRDTDGTGSPAARRGQCRGGVARSDRSDQTLGSRAPGLTRTLL